MGKASRRKRESRAFGPGIVLGDGHRYLRARDLPRAHPLLDVPVKHYDDGAAPTWRPLREDPDMLVAR